MTRKPIIGIIPTFLPEQGTFSVRQHYIDALVQAGASPLVLPFVKDVSIYETIFPLMSGFLLTGGQDIDPLRYGTFDQARIDDAINDTFTPEREEIEHLILSYADTYDIPVLGICRGMQMVNVFYGGTLYLDLAKERKESAELLAHWQESDYSQTTHSVTIKKGTRLARAMGCETIETNSIHHQGVRSIGARVKSSAFASDGLIEGIEVVDRTFIVGVQWHPEFLANESSMVGLFSELVEHAHERLNSGKLSIETPASATTTDEERLHQCPAIPKMLSIASVDTGETWPLVTFADYI